MKLITTIRKFTKLEYIKGLYSRYSRNQTQNKWIAFNKKIQKRRKKKGYA